MNDQSPADKSSPGHGSRVRVVVVDDSAVVRGLIAASLEKDSDIEVVATAANGRIAVDGLAGWDPDVVILDIEMPVMDGLTALPLLLGISPDLKVIIASTLTTRGAEISLNALAAGAAEYVAKPQASSLRGADEFRRDLVEKVKALGRGRARRSVASRPMAAPAIVRKPPPTPAVFTLRAMPSEIPQAIAIASSTGGPQALFKVTPALKNLRQPVFITQHMPPTFTTLLADHIGKLTGRPTREATDGMAVENGATYVAAGDNHMLIERATNGFRLRLSKSPPENFCRPSADPMLRSLVACFGRRLLCVVLTGMGQDGLEGCSAAVAAGAGVVAQNEATSVVWGMPGAVATAGLCSKVIPIEEIGPLVERLAQGTNL